MSQPSGNGRARLGQPTDDNEEVRVSLGLHANLLRPGAFMSNTLEWSHTIKDHGTVYGPLGDIPVACIDPIDIAAAAFHCLIEPKDSGAAYPLTGPEAISPRVQAATLAEIISKPIAFVDISPAETRRQMVEHGMPDVLADAVIATMTCPVDGHGQTVTSAVLELTGLPARSYRMWATSNAAAFV